MHFWEFCYGRFSWLYVYTDFLYRLLRSLLGLDVKGVQHNVWDYLAQLNITNNCFLIGLHEAADTTCTPEMTERMVMVMRVSPGQ